MTTLASTSSNAGSATTRSKPTLGFIYSASDYHITAQYLRDAVVEDRCVNFDLSLQRPDVDIQQLLHSTSAREEVPEVLLHETGAPCLPRGLNEIHLPTACLDIDTF